MNRAISWTGLTRLLGYSPEYLADLGSRAPSMYHEVCQPKKSGGVRKLHVPARELKEVQSRIAKILASHGLSNMAFAYRKGHCTAGALLPHKGQNYHFLVDIRDFFDSISASRVFHCLVDLGFIPDVAQVLTSILTLNGRLPQGTPTSPVLSNLAARHLDTDLLTFAEVHGLAVSRYSDDMLFSSGRDFRKLTTAIVAILRRHGFRVKPKKTAYKIGPVETLGLRLLNNRLCLGTEILGRMRAAQPQKVREGYLALLTMVRRLDSNAA